MNGRPLDLVHPEMLRMKVNIVLLLYYCIIVVLFVSSQHALSWVCPVQGDECSHLMVILEGLAVYSLIISFKPPPHGRHIVFDSVVVICAIPGESDNFLIIFTFELDPCIGYKGSL